MKIVVRVREIWSGHPLKFISHNIDCVKLTLSLRSRVIGAAHHLTERNI